MILPYHDQHHHHHSHHQLVLFTYKIAPRRVARMLKKVSFCELKRAIKKKQTKDAFD
jgi:hypothetical protein